MNQVYHVVIRGASLQVGLQWGRKVMGEKKIHPLGQRPSVHTCTAILFFTTVPTLTTIHNVLVSVHHSVNILVHEHQQQQSSTTTNEHDNQHQQYTNNTPTTRATINPDFYWFRLFPPIFGPKMNNTRLLFLKNYTDTLCNNST